MFKVVNSATKSIETVYAVDASYVIPKFLLYVEYYGWSWVDSHQFYPFEEESAGE